MKKKSIIWLSIIIVVFLSIGIVQGEYGTKYESVKLKLNDTSVLKLKIQGKEYDIPRSVNLDVPVIKLDVDSQITQIPFELDYTGIGIEVKNPEYSFTKPDGSELKFDNDSYAQGFVNGLIENNEDVYKQIAKGNEWYVNVSEYGNNLTIGEGYTVAFSITQTQKIKGSTSGSEILKVEYSLYSSESKFTFKVIAPLDIKIVQPENGSISSNITDEKFYEGDNIVLEAHPNEGYVFKGWKTTGDVVVDGNETGILNANQQGTITAEFEAMTPQEPEKDNQEPEVDNQEPGVDNQESEKDNQVIEDDNTKGDRVQTGDNIDLQLFIGCIFITSVVGFTLHRKKNM